MTNLTHEDCFCRRNCILPVQYYTKLWSEAYILAKSHLTTKLPLNLNLVVNKNLAKHMFIQYTWQVSKVTGFSHMYIV